jgi:hypothetical protein
VGIVIFKWSAVDRETKELFFHRGIEREKMMVCPGVPIK